MTEFLLLGISAAIALGVGAQYLAWRFRLPAILLLIGVGFFAGPIPRAVDASWALSPDPLLGDLLVPIVALSVALLIFEGSLHVRLSELVRGERDLKFYVPVVSLITWISCALIAQQVLGFGEKLSLLLGAILIGSGPSVVLPLLRDTPLKGRLGVFVRAEGTVSEVLGIILGVLIFQAIYASEVLEHSHSVVFAIAGNIFSAVALAIISSVVIISLLQSYRLPDFLRNPFVLAVVLLTYTIASEFANGSGLIACALLGIILGNQRLVSVKSILEFHESLQVILISTLTVILISRVDLTAVTDIGYLEILFILTLVILVRPLAALIATLRSSLSIQERLFLSSFAPRGLTPLCTSSLFVLELVDVGFPHAEKLLPIVLFVVVATVSLYGLTAPALARMYEVSEGDPRGIVFLGAHDWARALALVIQRLGYRVLLVDTNHLNITAGRREGLTTRHGNIFLDPTLDEVVLDGYGRLFALTSNDEVNTLAAIHFSELFGSQSVYQLSPEAGQEGELTRRYRHRTLQLTYEKIEKYYNDGFVVHEFSCVDQLAFDALKREHQQGFLPLFSVSKNGEIVERDFLPEGRLVALIKAEIYDKLASNERDKIIPFKRN